MTRAPIALVLALCFAGCGDDDNSADRVGIAAACSVDTDCAHVTAPDGGVIQLMCLTQFTDGYCGLPGCVTSADCPAPSICVHHTDGTNYCFRECVDKPECNANRSGAQEANCASDFDFADPADDTGQKACIPPSSG